MISFASKDNMFLLITFIFHQVHVIYPFPAIFLVLYKYLKQNIISSEHEQTFFISIIYLLFHIGTQLEWHDWHMEEQKCECLRSYLQLVSCKGIIFPKLLFVLLFSNSTWHHILCFAHFLWMPFRIPSVSKDCFCRLPRSLKSSLVLSFALHLKKQWHMVPRLYWVTVLSRRVLSEMS